MNTSALVACCTLSFVALATAQPAHVRVVRHDAPPGGNGQTWQTAYQHPQEALDEAAAAPGSFSQIWIAAGHYVPTERVDPEDPFSATFMLVSNISLYGGFAGFEQTLGERDPTANITVLDGGQQPGAQSGMYHVVTAINLHSAMLDGLTIQGGRQDPTLTSRGGGLRLIDSSPWIVNCTIRDNFAGSGGGMYATGGSPIIVSTRFINNEAQSGGGAVYLAPSDASFTDCIFENNRTTSSQGGASTLEGQGNITLTNCHISGGVLQSDQDIVRVGSSALFEGCTFENLRSGAIASGGTHIGGVFRNNYAFAVASHAVLINSLVTGNEVWRISASMGGVSHSTVINSTIINNVGEDWFPHTTVGVSRSTVVNSIIWGNCFSNNRCGEDAQVFKSDISYSLIQGWTQGGPGNFSADPRFADSFGRLSPTSAAIDTGNNLAVPAGITTDFDGNPRFQNDPGMPDRGIPGGAGGSNIVDIGAFEFQESTCYANCDNSTVAPALNIADFTCFINRYAEGDPYANCDGSTTEPILNVDDFTCFINAFAAGCP